MIVSCSTLETFYKNEINESKKASSVNESIILDDTFFTEGVFNYSEPESESNIDLLLGSEEKSNIPETFEIDTSKIVTNQHKKMIEEKVNKMSLENVEPMEFTGVDYQEHISFSANVSESLKNQLGEFLIPTGYKLIWDTPYDVTFENNVTYEGDDVLNILKAIANDLSKMGIDIHVNVYLKNKVVLVYSVRS